MSISRSCQDRRRWHHASRSNIVLSDINMAFARSAATAVLRSNLCRQCARSTRSFSQVAVKPVQRSNKLALGAVRWHSAPATSSKVYDFSHVKKLSESPSKETILVGRQISSCPQYTAIILTRHRRPRAIRIPSRLHSERYQSAHQDTARCAVPTRGRV